MEMRADPKAETVARQEVPEVPLQVEMVAQQEVPEVPKPVLKEFVVMPTTLLQRLLAWGH